MAAAECAEDKDVSFDEVDIGPFSIYVVVGLQASTIQS